MAFKTFQEMIDTLRAGQAAGMDCQITLKPDAAGDLADILQGHQDALRREAPPRTWNEVHGWDERG
jgi:hypothetical protein